MGHKPLLVVLIIIAVLVGVAMATGVHRDRTDPPMKDYKPGDGLQGKDRLLARFRDSLDLSRMTGCNRTNRILTLNGECRAVIAPGRASAASFSLKPVAGNLVRACYGLNQEQVEDCAGKSEGERGKLQSDGSRFVVGKDRAFLRLYCHPVGTVPCQVSVE